MTKILIADDDPNIRNVLRIALEAAGMQVTEASNGQVAVTEAARSAPDLVVLDIGMPEMDGMEACKTIRRTSQVPILFLTARDDEIDRVLGFELGADDYVSKPFSPRELVLRIRAILGRGQRAPQVLEQGKLRLSPSEHRCDFAGQDLPLTATEFTLLHHLIKAPDRVRSKNDLIEAVYGHNTELSGRTIDSHIRNIRQKAAQIGCNDVISTVHGVGVRLGPCQE